MDSQMGDLILFNVDFQSFNLCPVFQKKMFDYVFELA